MPSSGKTSEQNMQRLTGGAHFSNYRRGLTCLQAQAVFVHPARTQQIVNKSPTHHDLICKRNFDFLIYNGPVRCSVASQIAAFGVTSPFPVQV